MSGATSPNRVPILEAAAFATASAICAAAFAYSIVRFVLDRK